MPTKDVSIYFVLAGHSKGVVTFLDDKEATAFLKLIDSELVEYELAIGRFDATDFPHRTSQKYRGPHYYLYN